MMRAERPGRDRRWLPVLALLAVMFLLVSGGYVVAGTLSTQQGPPVVVGGSVRVFPLSGWQTRDQGTVGELAGASMTRGNATLDVFTTQVNFGPEVMLVRYVNGFLKPAAQHLSVSKSVDPVTLDSGLEGLRVSYVGTFGDRAIQVEGEVTAVVSPTGTGVIFDAWGATGLFGYAHADTREMVRTAELA